MQPENLTIARQVEATYNAQVPLRFTVENKSISPRYKSGTHEEIEKFTHRVKKIAKDIQYSKPVDPIIAIEIIDEGKYVVIQGHDIVAAYNELQRPFAKGWTFGVYRHELNKIDLSQYWDRGDGNGTV